MISDDDIERAVDYLRDSATKAAKAKAERIYLEEFRRVVKSNLMRENKDESLGAQEAIAYADPKYKQHLEVMRDAIERDEYHRWMLTAAEAKIEAWRTQQSNARAYRNTPYSEPAPPPVASPDDKAPPAEAVGADRVALVCHTDGTADFVTVPSPHSRLREALGFASKTLNERFKGRLIASGCKSIEQMSNAKAEAAITWLSVETDKELAAQEKK